MKIAMTGASGFLGSLVLKKLVEDPFVSKIVVFDLQRPLRGRFVSNKVVFHRIDLTHDNATAKMVKALQVQGEPINTFIHGALQPNPSRQRNHQREIENIGTFHVLNTLAATKIPHLIVFSGTFVYGAKPKNPNFIKENRPLSKNSSSFVKLRAEVEHQIQEFAHDYPKTVVTTLRFAPILGPNSTDARAQYFLKDIVPKVLGFDPLVQFIHEDDALRAVQCVLAQYESKKDTLRGVFNIVGRGVFPLTTGIHISGKIALSIPTFLCEKLFSIGYNLKLWELPEELVPFYKFLCIADGSKAKKILGFEARYSSRQALKAVVETNKVHFLGFTQNYETTKVLGEEKHFTTNFKRLF